MGQSYQDLHLLMLLQENVFGEIGPLDVAILEAALIDSAS
jgi:hypothetical protein